MNQDLFTQYHREYELLRRENERIKELRGQGKTYDEISKELGCSMKTIQRIFKIKA